MSGGNDRWELYRLDDNGNRFPVGRYATREEAEAAQRDFEMKCHKQAYLVKKAILPDKVNSHTSPTHIMIKAMTTQASIDQFLSHPHLALAGVSRSGRKFGNILHRELTAKGYRVSVIHPETGAIDGVVCHPSLSALTAGVGGLLLSVPPERAEPLVREAADAGIRDIWLLPGAESDEAIEQCRQRDINVIHGECVLMYARPTGIHRLHRWLRGIIGRLPS